jgi:hypothetical protein
MLSALKFDHFFQLFGDRGGPLFLPNSMGHVDKVSGDEIFISD